MITFPTWFIIAIGLLGLKLVFVALRLMLNLKGKIIATLKNAPEERKRSWVTAASRYLKILKLALWVFPINLVALPYLVYVFEPKYLFHVGIIVLVAYVLIFEEYSYRRSMLDAVET